jgi:hypothetical protein
MGLSEAPISVLYSRAVDALQRTDAVSLGEVLSECSNVEAPVLQDEIDFAVRQRAILKKLLEHTSMNLRVLRSETSARGVQGWQH